jgi:hypothetical protein
MPTNQEIKHRILRSLLIVVDNVMATLEAHPGAVPARFEAVLSLQDVVHPNLNNGKPFQIVARPVLDLAGDEAALYYMLYPPTPPQAVEGSQTQTTEASATVTPGNPVEGTPPQKDELMMQVAPKRLPSKKHRRSR